MARIHWLQHVPFEGLGYINDWAAAGGADLSCTRLYAGDKLPEIDDFDLLVVMGGPMNIHDHSGHPWLVSEKAFLKEVVDADKSVLGICLGAQLLADVLGAAVYPGEHKEIGWFTLQAAPPSPWWLPDGLTAFHWHGDTFDIPEGAIRLAASQACPNQGFVYNTRVIALQFHLETTPASMEALICNCSHELVEAPFIQSAEEIRDGSGYIDLANRSMKALLDYLIG